MNHYFYTFKFSPIGAKKPGVWPERVDASLYVSGLKQAFGRPDKFEIRMHIALASTEHRFIKAAFICIFLTPYKMLKLLILLWTWVHKINVICHFVRETDDSSTLEDILENCKRNPAKWKADVAYKPADNSNWYWAKVAVKILYFISTSCYSYVKVSYWQMYRWGWTILLLWVKNMLWTGESNKQFCYCIWRR